MSDMFIPLPGFSNSHIQTILPKILRRHILINPIWQRLDLPDGDFIDITWSEPPEQAKHKPRIVLFHGLGGNFYSPYAHGFLKVWKELGYLGILMHFRGCSGEPNRKPRLYFSGDTDDMHFFLTWLQNHFGYQPTAAVGISLGGNMLAYYLAEDREVIPLDAAVTVSAPFLLEPCAEHIEKGIYRLYNNYLMSELKSNAIRKLKSYPNSLPITLRQVEKLKYIIDFDDAITAPVHGFLHARDYYRKCSAFPHLPKIKKPLLIIHAKDDPFMTKDVILDARTLPNNIEYQLTQHGGHVGFVGGTLLKPELWLEHRIPSWLSTFLR